MSDGELGRKIAFHRQRRGLSQREFAPLIERSEAWLSQVERGVRPVKGLDVLEKIARVLDVPLAELAPTAPTVAADELPAEALPLRLLLSANYALRAAVDAEYKTIAKVDVLRVEASKAWTLAHSASYSELIPLLEWLLPNLESAALIDGPHAPEVFALLARSYHACAAALAKLGQFDAAWVAADRAISDAGRAADPLLMAEGAFRLTLVFQGARQLDQARHAAETAATALQGLAQRGSVEALSVYGALHLQLAVIAARTERADDASKHLQIARKAADELGHDRNDYETEFGPTNVRLHEVAVAVELSDAGAAIRAADGIDARALSPERQGRLLIDVARAWTQRRNVAQAVTALTAAERITPEQITSHRLVKTMLRDLLRMESEPNAELVELARRAGVVA
ncbi:MAG: helix-turn-helix domain-containing protein [Actinophytocola sp.]|uniref:helix-turn-helix domain-containing protein n=1 Tax=Actinophytocola sp. TaxID=1872138 RepID=UPI00132C7275|nr:helix-turn-helix transcriptional regulator [Actinophytocola sp.]MPZ85227.1 helix-turn-helix domain-containing protein [Actinophytocola sp.]